jgi:Glycosyltransferase family 43
MQMTLVGFLRSLNLDMAKIEPKANNCSEILVWHTKTLKTSTVDLNPPVALAKSDSLDPLLKRMQQISLIKFNSTGECLSTFRPKLVHNIRTFGCAVNQSKAVPLKSPVVVMKAKKKFFKPIAKRVKRRA